MNGIQTVLQLLQRIVSSPWPDLVGVDVGERAVRIVRVKRRGARAAVVSSGERAIDAEGADPAERRELVKRALADLVRERSLKGKEAALAVSGSDVVIRRISMPPMSRADLLPALTLECRKHVNFPMEEAELRYEILPKPEGSESPDVPVLVTIAHRRPLDELRELLEAAGLRPSLLTIRPIALRTLLRASSRIEPNEVVAYLDVESLYTHITVIKGEDIRFSREFGVGGATLTEALRRIVVPGQGTLELSWEEAEALKRAHGIPLGSQEAGSAGRIPLSAVSVMLRPALERFVRDLWNSFDYCNEQFQGEAVTRLVLLGAGSQVLNLPEYLAGVLKIRVERADLAESAMPSRGRARPGQDGISSESALGLALTNRSALNFARPAGAGVPYRVAEAIPQRAAAAAAAVLVISVALPAEVNVARERGRVETLQHGLSALAPRMDGLRRFRAAREEETRLHDLLEHLTGGQVLWSYALRDLSHRVGPDVRLTALDVLEPEVPAAGTAQAASAQAPVRQVRITGLLRTQSRRPEEVLGELMQSLARSPVLGGVRLEGCQAVSPSVSEFTITAGIAE